MQSGCCPKPQVKQMLVERLLCRRRLLAMKHVPGATLPRQQSSSRALNLPRVPLSLSQSCALANTAQLTPLGHRGQQPRLVSPARFSSSFARPPVPRSQSPLRRLAERSIEQTGSQSLAGLPATQDEYQVLLHAAQHAVL